MNKKFCINCKHIEIAKHWDDYERKIYYSRCIRPELILNVVNGEQKKLDRFCRTERQDGLISSIFFNTCGKRGKFYEEKNNE